MDDDICQCPVCEENPAPTPDEVIVGLTAALLKQDWHLVATITQTLQDHYGTLSDDDVMDEAGNEVVKMALSRVVLQTTPIEA